MLIVGFVLLWCPIIFVFLYLIFNYMIRGKNSVCIVVLGDIGRSPRMQYHASSFAAEGFSVDIVGYGGSTPHSIIKNSKRITLYELVEVPGFLKTLPCLFGYVIKVLFQSCTLGIKLLLLPKSGFIFLQNPPSIPTIAVCWVVCLLRGSKLLVDWHNYGYTILGLSLGNDHSLVRFSKWYEHAFGRMSDVNICVTKAMKKDLKENWNIRAETLYDRPADMFQQTSLPEAHKLFTKLAQQYEVFTNNDLPNSTAFTTQSKGGRTEWLTDRPALIMSSTSWTADEDFGILLSALSEYDEASKKENSLPQLICVITGKGPQKEFYRNKIAKHKWSRVKFCLPWLEAEDYPKLLGAADLGICLHASSSGLDLPMKVVDMFGCGLPVCALKFNCISELVEHGQNGLIFEDSQELCQQLKTLMVDYKGRKKQLSQMRNNLQSFQKIRWHESWKSIVLPLLEDKIKSH
ncbi:chitobiosyldiphosphodolichol beta-mannosyltransferase-like isoform X1 [Saccostrea echinata]|uniref:chitobiosyldiphosphodolichol beta-mannosyltransferase-like isoform X1 n=1 Tax=Saccostrea echinata TaxID=191078 RepID=UPI002A8396A5|nr:chitobiosyldiphosphodolichol beta-mannosyltransferase-like isoform X1 [Saccostrea echinata]